MRSKHAEKADRRQAAPKARVPSKLVKYAGYVGFTVLMLFGLWYTFLGYNAGPNYYDEGLAVYGAQRVVDGFLPYKDFWTLYAPGHFYILAAIFRIFGSGLIVERIWSLLIIFAGTVAAYAVARKLAPTVPALFAWACSVLIVNGFLAGPVPPALLLALLGILSLISYLENRRTLWLVLGGLAGGGCMFVRHDYGGYALVAGLVVISLFNARQPSQGRSPLSSALRADGLYLLGAAIVLVPSAAYFLSVVPVRDMVYDLITFPLTVYPKVRGVSLGGPLHQLAGGLSDGAGFPVILSMAAVAYSYYFPFLVNAAALALLIIRWRKRGLDTRGAGTYPLLLVLLFSSMLCVYVSIRADILHLVPVLTPAFVLSAAVVAGGKDAKRLAQVFTVLAALMFLTVAGLWAPVKLPYVGANFSLSTLPYTLERAQHIRDNPDRMIYQQAAEYIMEQVPPSEPIYVGVEGHDNVLMNDILLYYLSERDAGTRYYELHPGLTTTAEIQSYMVDELERNGVNYILIALDRAKSQEPNESSISTGVHILDDYIRANFRGEVLVGDRILILRRT